MSIEAIHDWMVKHHKTLALAESCTGGFMASQLTALSGASDYFLGSLVTYANQLKEDLLDVSPETLKKHGAVSREVVHEMWTGLMQKTGADYGSQSRALQGLKAAHRKNLSEPFCMLLEKRAKNLKPVQCISKETGKPLSHRRPNRCLIFC
jgi:PncC family amidohydrolase